MKNNKSIKSEIVFTILRNYHYHAWAKATQKRSSNEMPANMKNLYSQFEELIELPAFSEKEKKKQIKDLKKICTQLKREFAKLKRGIKHE